MVHIVDWFPTLLSLAGLDQINFDVDGVNLWPLIERDVAVRNNIVYNIDVDDQSETFQLAARKGNYKIIWGQTKEFKEHKKGERKVFLFNLKTDPHERENLAETEPTILEKMKNFLIKVSHGVRPAFHPGGLSLGYPRYHGGRLEPGWCTTDWWSKLWKYQINTDFLNKIVET